MSEARSIRGGSQPHRRDLSTDPVFSWYSARAQQLEADGLVIEWVNPFGEASPEFMVGPFTVFRCKATGFRFANPRLKPKAVIEYFRNNRIKSYYDAVEASIERRKEIAYRPIAEMLKPNVKPGGRILEVGCGGGGLLEVLRDEYGYLVEGNEVATGAEEYQNERGLKVSNVAFEEFSPETKFDAIVMWSVMDHFANPVAVLKKCADLLEGGGVIAIGNINTAGFDHQTIGSDINTYAPPTRVNYYDIASLTAHLEHAGLRVTLANTPGTLDVDIVADYWRTGGTNGHSPFLESLLLDPANEAKSAEFQKYLTNNQLAGYLTLLATKSST